MYQTVMSYIPFNPYQFDDKQTANATKTVIQIIAIPTDSAVMITCHISGIKSDGSLALNMVVHASYKNDGGTVTEQGFETGAHAEIPTNWNFNIDIDSTDVKPSVTGTAGVTINWTIATLVNIAKV